MGNGQAAMELMGQWAPSVQASASTGKKGLGDKLGFFPFPAVDGGKGLVTDAFGGGNGFAVGKDAPAATVDFLKFIAQRRQPAQSRRDRRGPADRQGRHRTPSRTPTTRSLVAKTLAAATGFQLYLDQAYPPAVGQQVNDSVAELIAGARRPRNRSSQAITEVAKSQYMAKTRPRDRRRPTHARPPGRRRAAAWLHRSPVFLCPGSGRCSCLLVISCRSWWPMLHQPLQVERLRAARGLRRAGQLHPRLLDDPIFLGDLAHGGS